ncbi:uncharacterized protein F5Z01DRAFT_653188 [Emericellopsis atlantica]|uniref:Uncharacterized protein n=1 Tax=Emericellopsis atlantica TaxID=2614577 RepID=A0A9P8CQN1_9HYPO|nr:uncharacterized protein F5Z01DRAFT_653188 [Emericellopsis atlantica]KAG9255477.1 hypothetical protein F5Z01DRAFT_653188 [Emericellopsis atlantica]
MLMSTYDSRPPFPSIKQTSTLGPTFSVMSFDCGSLNVTECLVQAADRIVAEVRRGNDEFNWDPLSFAVTAIISMVALLFAGLTIVQGFLTLGPGRHKCSEYAIGSWAQYSTHRWNMSELRFRSEAYTPILDCGKLVFDALTHTSRRQQDQDSNASARPDGGQGRISLVQKEAYEYYPATWLAFLTILGLDHPHYFDMKVSGPDYMPSDLTAAPAYASVRDMYTLCAMLGAEGHRLRIGAQEGGGPPSMHSGTFDLNFRQHPLLGTYGVVQTYGALGARGSHVGTPKQRSDQHLLRLSLQGRMTGVKSMHFYRDETAQAAILLANGYIPQHKLIGNQVILIKAHCTRPLSDIQHQGRHWRAHALDRLSRAIERSHSDAGLTELECCPSSDVPWPRWCTMPMSFSEASALINMDVFQGGLHLLGASTTNHLTPKLFPIRTMDIGMRLLGLISLSRLWSLEQTAPAQDSDPDAPPHLLRLVAMPLDRPGSEDEHKTPREGDIFFSDPDVFALSRKYIKRRGWQDPLWELTRDKTTTLQKELDRIDRWLGIDEHASRASRRAVACRWLSLSCTAAACWKVSPADMSLRSRCPWLKISKTPRRGRVDPAELRYITPEVRSNVERLLDDTTRFCDWFPSHARHIVQENLYGAADDILGPCRGAPEEQEVFDSLVRELRKFGQLWTADADAEQHPLDNLLIYRAILVAMRLSLATDNSSLVDNEAYLRLVPIL